MHGQKVVVMKLRPELEGSTLHTTQVEVRFLRERSGLTAQRDDNLITTFHYAHQRKITDKYQP